MVYNSLQIISADPACFSPNCVQNAVPDRDDREIRPVNQYLGRMALAGAMTALVSACGAAQSNVANSEQVAQSAAATQGTGVTDQQLPINQRFSNLDEYLAWLEKTAAPVDRPSYKEIRPGVYELQTAGNLHLDVPAD